MINNLLITVGEEYKFEADVKCPNCETRYQIVSEENEHALDCANCGLTTIFELEPMDEESLKGQKAMLDQHSKIWGDDGKEIVDSEE